MKRAMHAVALLLLLVGAVPVLAQHEALPAGSTPAPVVVVVPPAAPPANDLVNQYGDPDDAITGNRGNSVVGGAPIYSPTSSAAPPPALAGWLLSIMVTLVPSI
ncbi:hypothetical protein HGA89_02725 [bacterium]|nr:hypothetical protein [bacterium]